MSLRGVLLRQDDEAILDTTWIVKDCFGLRPRKDKSDVYECVCLDLNEHLRRREPTDLDERAGGHDVREGLAVGASRVAPRQDW